MTGKERVRTVLDHKSADRIAFDMGSCAVTGIHCRALAALRKHYGLDDHPVFVHEPGQMLGLVEDDLAEVLGIDAKGAFAPKNAIGVYNADWKEYKMPWGQVVMLPAKMADSFTPHEGGLYTYPEGDLSLPPSGYMPERCFFFDSLERQQGEIDDDKLNVEDNLQEYGPIDDATLEYWKGEVDKAAATGRAVVASFGGMALGDVARIISPAIREPRGIRSVAEWYMSTVCRPDYIKEMFDRQTDIAIANLQKIWNVVGDKVDVVYVCGADFGTQTGQFLSVDTFRDLYFPYYKKMNDWIHQHTTWKTFKHSCGAVYPLIDSLIECGFDILNPVQIAATGMDPRRLKDEFGSRITFWGGGIDTQNTLPFGTPEQIRDEVFRLCDIFGQDGGFVFNTVHNIQANVPVENIVALMEAVKEVRHI